VSINSSGVERYFNERKLTIHNHGLESPQSGNHRRAGEETFHSVAAGEKYGERRSSKWRIGNEIVVRIQSGEMKISKIHLAN
jgi:hypothetical protein